MSRRGRTQSTIDLYHRPLMEFAEWAGDRDVDTFEPRHMEAYFDHYEGQRSSTGDQHPSQG